MTTPDPSPQVIVDFGAVYHEVNAAIRVHNGKAKRNGCMCNITPANIQQPADRFR